MANEAFVQAALRIVKGKLTYQSQPYGFMADVSVANGPTPGAVTVSKYGTDINLSQLAVPGLCRITNLDDTNYVEYGSYDLDSPIGQFFPFGEILPGESYVLRLSRFIGQQLGTGSGTLAREASGITFRMKAVNASVVVLVEAFDR